jgi:hypothetical protein
MKVGSVSLVGFVVEHIYQEVVGLNVVRHRVIGYRFKVLLSSALGGDRLTLVYIDGKGPSIVVIRE